jgi:hypothetical protein
VCATAAAQGLAALLTTRISMHMHLGARLLSLARTKVALPFAAARSSSLASGQAFCNSAVPLLLDRLSLWVRLFSCKAAAAEP